VLPELKKAEVRAMLQGMTVRLQRVVAGTKGSGPVNEAVLNMDDVVGTSMMS